jgi:hypothetical protein
MEMMLERSKGKGFEMVQVISNLAEISLFSAGVLTSTATAANSIVRAAVSTAVASHFRVAICIEVR